VIRGLILYLGEKTEELIKDYKVKKTVSKERKSTKRAILYASFTLIYKRVLFFLVYFTGF
jgi:hypothetical protein